MVDEPHAEQNNQQQTAPQEQYNAPFAVSISFPDSVTIKMVDATALGDYELGLFLSAFAATVSVGFCVAYVQDTTQTYLMTITLCAGVVALAFFLWALSKRSRMKARSKTFKLKTSGVEEVKE